MNASSITRFWVPVNCLRGQFVKLWVLCWLKHFLSSILQIIWRREGMIQTLCKKLGGDSNHMWVDLALTPLPNQSQGPPAALFPSLTVINTVPNNPHKTGWTSSIFLQWCCVWVLPDLLDLHADSHLQCLPNPSLLYLRANLPALCGLTPSIHWRASLDSNTCLPVLCVCTPDSFRCVCYLGMHLSHGVIVLSCFNWSPLPGPSWPTHFCSYSCSCETPPSLEAREGILED